MEFASGGSALAAQIFHAAGGGIHPVALICHGFPGNEQNLDLARALQRAGWAVVTFHYRGSWGSEGAFTFRGGVADAKAILARLKTPKPEWGIDPSRLIVIGHSYGGYVAARAAADTPGVTGVALIAPWDMADTARSTAKMTEKQKHGMEADLAGEAKARLAGTSGAAMVKEILGAADLDLTLLAPALARMPVLLLTASRDTPDDQAAGLQAALGKIPGAHLSAARMETDHGFDDRRIALESAILDWAAGLPGAPR